MEHINELGNRANINVYSTSDTEVVLYEDHRVILNVLFFLKEKNDLSTPIDIFMFDNHDDACETNQSANEIIDEFNLTNPSIEKFWSFVEFNLNGLDDDWVIAGMELGLINNVFLFNSKETTIDNVKTHTTRKFGNKKIYNLGNVWNVLRFKSKLNDLHTKDLNSQLLDDIGWIFNDSSYRFEFIPKNDFIVDVDLDCFSTEIYGTNIAIRKDILKGLLTEQFDPKYQPFSSAKEFMKELINLSKLTTMCFENGSCGGIYESFNIFNSVNEIIFDGEIGR